MKVKGSGDAATSAEMATKSAELRKNFERVVLKGKGMAASRPCRDECRRRYRIVRGEKNEVVCFLACAVHL